MKGMRQVFKLSFAATLSVMKMVAVLQIHENNTCALRRRSLFV
jgi:hypothetical protein